MGIVSLLNRGLLKKKRTDSHWGSKFFPLRVSNFSEVAWLAGKQTESHKSCLPCKERAESVTSISNLHPHAPHLSPPHSHHHLRYIRCLHSVNLLFFLISFDMNQMVVLSNRGTRVYKLCDISDQTICNLNAFCLIPDVK